MLERHGFERTRRLGKHHWVVTRVVPWTSSKAANPLTALARTSARAYRGPGLSTPATVALGRWSGSGVTRGGEELVSTIRQ
jgi:hypothetical protein